MTPVILPESRQEVQGSHFISLLELGKIKFMSTAEIRTTDPQELADQEAVMRHAFQGEPLDPEVLRRVDERADRITEEIRRIHGIIDDKTFDELLRDDDDES